MFPINYNDPYMKNDGSVVPIGEVAGGSDLPDYGIADAGKVLTVGEDGELEWHESGAGGGDAFLAYDFTKLANKNWGSAICTANDGATISGYTSSIPVLSGVSYYQLRDITIYIDSTKLEVDNTRTSHQRAIMGTSERGLIYEKTNHTWSLYTDNGWNNGEVTDPDIFNNSKIKIYIDSDGKWSVYSDDTLIVQSSAGITIENIKIGASEQGIKSAIIPGIRFYNGNYTE